MTQRSYTGKAHVHYSGTIEITGTTESGRELSIYLPDSEIEKLQKVFEFARVNNIPLESLGHAHWHIVEGKEDGVNCESCVRLRN